jgi:hypothetical protein
VVFLWAIPKFVGMYLKRAHEIGWKPTFLVGSVSNTGADVGAHLEARPARVFLPTVSGRGHPRHHPRCVSELLPRALLTARRDPETWGQARLLIPRAELR